ncbi:MAG TPA: ABC transporter permease [Capillimicrobium sp.]|jgi:ribose transport system permease protein
MSARTSAALQRALVVGSPVLLLGLVVAVIAVVEPRVLEGSNPKEVVTQAAPIAILALGAMVVLITAGIDLSAASGVAMVAVSTVAAMSGGAGLVEAIAVGVLLGLALGLVNGVLVGVVRIPAFIATLATFGAVQGVTLTQAKSGTLIVSDPTLLRIGTGTLFGIPSPIVIAAVVAAVMAVLLRMTRFGVRTYALGSQEPEAARLSGVPVARHLVLVYTLAGLLTAITAVVLAGRAGVVAPNIGGISLLLDAIAATILGGTSIFGGRGSVVGTLLGAIVIALITNALRVSGADASSLDLWRGAIIGMALTVDAGLQLVRRRLEDRQVAAVRDAEVHPVAAA